MDSIELLVVEDLDAVDLLSLVVWVSFFVTRLPGQARPWENALKMEKVTIRED
jgi:hypothetical protein